MAGVAAMSLSVCKQKSLFLNTDLFTSTVIIAFNMCSVCVNIVCVTGF